VDQGHGADPVPDIVEYAPVAFRPGLPALEGDEARYHLEVVLHAMVYFLEEHLLFPQ